MTDDLDEHSDEGGDGAGLRVRFFDGIVVMHWLLNPPPRPNKRLRPLHPGLEDTLDRIADEEWGRVGFSEIERDVWRTAGLSRDEAATAAQCRSAGIPPAALQYLLGDRRVIDRLRDRDNPFWIAGQLSRHWLPKQAASLEQPSAGSHSRTPAAAVPRRRRRRG